MIKVLGLALYGPQAASHRVRLSQYVKRLLDFDISLEIHSLLDDDYVRNRFSGKQLPLASVLRNAWARLRLLRSSNRFDIAIVNCELFPLFPGWLERALVKIPYIYDFDDAFYLRYRQGRLAILSPLLGNKFDSFIGGAAAVTAGNGFLRDYAIPLNRYVTVLPSVVDTNFYVPLLPDSNLEPQPFTVGWVGSPSTAPYLQQIVTPLERLAQEMPIRLIVVGGKAPVVANVDVIELPWDGNTEVEIINRFDVGVMPIPDSEWARGKCAFKLIQYMACGIPVIGSNVGANIDVVTPLCGFLANTQDDWFTALRYLRDSQGLRGMMGMEARKRAISYFSLEHNLPLFSNVIKDTAQRAGLSGKKV